MCVLSRCVDLKMSYRASLRFVGAKSCLESCGRNSPSVVFPYGPVLWIGYECVCCYARTFSSEAMSPRPLISNSPCLWVYSALFTSSVHSSCLFQHSFFSFFWGVVLSRLSPSCRHGGISEGSLDVQQSLHQSMSAGPAPHLMIPAVDMEVSLLGRCLLARWCAVPSEELI